MFLIPWIYEIHKNVLLRLISVRVITRHRTIATRGIKHNEVAYKNKTYIFSVILTSLYYWYPSTPFICKIIMLNAFKISFPPPHCMLSPWHKNIVIWYWKYIWEKHRAKTGVFLITAMIAPSHPFPPSSKFAVLIPTL